MHLLIVIFIIIVVASFAIKIILLIMIINVIAKYGDDYYDTMADIDYALMTGIVNFNYKIQFVSIRQS